MILFHQVVQIASPVQESKYPKFFTCLTSKIMHFYDLLI